MSVFPAAARHIDVVTHGSIGTLIARSGTHGSG